MNRNECHKKYTQNSRRESGKENLISCWGAWKNVNCIVSHLSVVYLDVVFIHISHCSSRQITFQIVFSFLFLPYMWYHKRHLLWLHLLSPSFITLFADFSNMQIFLYVSLHVSLIWNIFMFRRHFTKFIYYKRHYLW